MSNPKDKAKYVVAPRRSVTTKAGIVEEGQPVNEEEVDVKSLLKKKAIVRR